MDYNNEIFEPRHINTPNIIYENYYEHDSDASNSSASSSSSQQSNSSQLSNSSQSKRKTIPWVEVQRYTDLNLAENYVDKFTSTRDTTKLSHG